MSEPRRIQRRRTPGWRMPEGAVYVGRPSRWGNEYRLGEPFLFSDAVYSNPDDPWNMGIRPLRDRADLVKAYRQGCELCTPDELAEWFAPLRGRDLVCWCPLDQPCHADVLLELANA